MEEKSKQALYRRYRSTSFDEVVGQEHVTDLLSAAVKSGNTSHAYLFTGPRGTGKTSVARILAYALNDLPYDQNATNLDIIEIDAASNRRIDDIRDLREKVHIAPVSAKYKVYIIDEVHMLTSESFNALLKTIEEPPAHAIFILATTELHKVPATIVSRTQRFHFRPATEKKVVELLKSIAKKEKIVIDDGALSLIATHGGGSFRDSVSLLDQLGGLGQAITAELVETVLGRARSTDIQQIIDALWSNDQTTLQSILDRTLSAGVSPVTLSEQLLGTLLASVQPSSRWYELSEKLMAVPRAHFPQLLLVSTLLGFTSHADTEDIKPPKIAPSPPDAAPTEKITKQAEVKPAEQPKSEEVKSSVTPGSFDWDAIIAATKTANPSLHSVLSRASASFEGDTLTLNFKYALHRKKLEQPQSRVQLSRAIQDVCGLNPTIVIEGASPTIAADETTQHVADLMGGGEVVAA